MTSAPPFLSGFFPSFLAALGLEFRAYILSYPTSPFFVVGFFNTGSCKLFTQAGFQLQSS
jgi:hypothetical protein